MVGAGHRSRKKTTPSPSDGRNKLPIVLARRLQLGARLALEEVALYSEKALASKREREEERKVYTVCLRGQADGQSKASLASNKWVLLLSVAGRGASHWRAILLGRTSEGDAHRVCVRPNTSGCTCCNYRRRRGGVQRAKRRRRHQQDHSSELRCDNVCVGAIPKACVQLTTTRKRCRRRRRTRPTPAGIRQRAHSHTCCYAWP